MKRILILVLTIGMLAGALMLSPTAVKASQTANTAVSTDTDALEPGDTFTVTITNRAMTVASFTCGLSFDPSVLRVVALKSHPITISEGGQWHAFLSSTPGQSNTTGTIGFAYANHKNRSYDSGIVAEITFEAVRSGDARITLYEDSDGQNGAISANVETITCQIGTASVAVMGDLDLDNDVDAYDLTMLARHVGGIELVTGQALMNADVDGSGDVDAYDLTRHARYVGGIITDWDQS